MFITFLAPLGSACFAADECDKRSAYALLIGITDYKKSDERNLEGPINDVALMEEILRNRFKILPENIISVTNEKATHIGIKRAFGDLAAKETACDFVYIHYSGHGAQFDNKEKEERCDREELDQTWVSYGARSDQYLGDMELNNHDVLDDEINDWLTRLDTDNYVFVSDSCHSGTAFRGHVDGVRSAADYRGKHPLAQAALRCEGDNRGIKIGAARDVEEAIETRPKLGNDDKKVFGRFTWYWAKSLEKASPAETWSDVFKRAYALVTTDKGSRKQYPQLTGNADRSIFGGNFVAPAQTVQITEVGASGRTVTLGAGAVANMTEDSEFSLFRRGKPVTPDRPRLRISEVDPARSVGEVLQGTFSKGDPVIETKRVYALDPYRLIVDPSCDGEQRNLGPREQDQPLFERLRNALGTLEGFEMADSSKAADFFVCVLRPQRRGNDPVRAGPGAGLPDYFPKADPEVWIVDKGGLSPVHERLKLSLRRPEEGLEKLRENLKSYLRGQEVVRFGIKERTALRPDIRLSVNLLREARADECEAEDVCRTVPLKGFEGKRFRAVGQAALDELAGLQPQKDDLLEFRVHNNSNSHFYVYVLNISKNLAVSIIYPNPDIDPRQEYAKFKPGEDRVLDYGMWQFDAGDEDWFKFIASMHPIDVNVFVRKGLAEYRGSRSLTEPPKSLEELLGAALHTRGHFIVRPRQEWFVEQVELKVK
jgi:hypothetical protein